MSTARKVLLGVAVVVAIIIVVIIARKNMNAGASSGNAGSGSTSGSSSSGSAGAGSTGGSSSSGSAGTGSATGTGGSSSSGSAGTGGSVYATPNFYMKDPGGGYVNGVSLEGARSYCAANGGSLASIDQLRAARAAGFEACAFGWVNDGSVAFAMQQTNSPGCETGPDGLYIAAKLPTERYGAYCSGAAPSSIPAALKTKI